MMKVYKPTDTIYLKALAEFAYIAIAWYRPLKFDTTKEHVCAMYLDKDCKLLEFALVNVGESHKVIFNVRSVFQNGHDIGAKYVILLHNHPHEADPTPSPIDLKTSNMAKIIASEWCLEFVSAIVVGNNSAYSIFENERFGVWENNNTVFRDIANMFKNCENDIPSFTVINNNSDDDKKLTHKLKNFFGITKNKIKAVSTPKVYNSILDTDKYKKLSKSSN